MTMRNAIAKGAIAAGLGLGLMFGVPGQAFAVAPSVDGTPSNPTVQVDQSNDYKAGDTVKVSVSQKVGNARYSKFVISDIIDGGVLQVDGDEPAHVYKEDSNGNRVEVRHAGRYAYDEDTHVLSFSFSDEYLKSMNYDGETYVLEYTLKVTDAETLQKTASGASSISFGIGASSTIAVEGHDDYTKGATTKTINVDTEETTPKSEGTVIDGISDFFTGLFSDHEYDVVSTHNSDVKVEQAKTSSSHVIGLKQVEALNLDTVGGGTSNASGTPPIDDIDDGNTNANGNVNEIPTIDDDDVNTNTGENKNTGTTIGNGANTSENANENENTAVPAKASFKLGNITFDEGSVNPGDAITGFVTITPSNVTSDTTLSLSLVGTNGSVSIDSVTGANATKEGGNATISANGNNVITVKFTFTATNGANGANGGVSATLTGNAVITGENDTASGTVKTKQPVANGSIKVNDTTLETGGTIRFTLDGTVTGGDAKGVVRTASINTDISGISVTASNGGTYDESTHTVTWKAEDVKEGGSLSECTIDVTIPDTRDAMNHSITVKGSITGTNIEQTTLGGDAMATTKLNSMSGNATISKTSVNTGESFDIDVSGTVGAGHVKNGKVSVTIDDVQDTDITASGGSVSNGTVTFNDADNGTSIQSRKITVNIPDEKGYAGKSIKVTAKYTGDNIEDTDLTGGTVSVSKAEFKSSNDAVSIDNQSPSAGDTVTFTVTPTVLGGEAHDVETNINVSGADGCTITMDGQQVSNNIKIPLVAKASGALGPYKVSVTLPSDTSMNGKSISVTATSTAKNADATSLGSATATVQAPTITSTKSAKSTKETIPSDESQVDDSVDVDAKTQEAKDKDAEANKDEKVIINNGDDIEYTDVIEQTSPDAHANDVIVTDTFDDYSAKHGVIIDKDTLKVDLNGNEVTPDVTWVTGDDGGVTGFSINLGKMNGHDKATITYTATAGKASNDLLRGRDITNTTNVTSANAVAPEDASVDVTIADASIKPKTFASTKEIPIGQNVSFETLLVNDSDNTSSIAKDVRATASIDDYFASLSGEIDPSTLQILSIEDGKVTDITKSADITWTEKKSVTIDTKSNLSATRTSKDATLDLSDDESERYEGIDHAIVIRYGVSTANVSPDVIGDTAIVTTIVSRADNATYDVSTGTVSLVGADVPVAEEDQQGGSIDDTDGGMSQTGDTTPYVIGGISIVAIVIVIIALIRRHRK